MAANDYLSADEILQQDDIKTITVVVPEWGGKKIRLRTMTAREAIDFTRTLEGEGQLNANVRAVIHSAVDENGRKLFREDQQDALMAKSTKAITRLAAEIRDLNGLDEKKLKEEAKNVSSGAVSGGSPTASQLN